MLSAELITTLRQLDRDEKLRVVQLLVNDLVPTPLTAEEEKRLNLIQPGVTYEVWSPQVESGMDELLQRLEAEKAKAGV
ncbi:MAG: hypothetical protein SGI73_14150 [Chloroflexota bacterium]|nr:hypothetical protein [Chloroflexota bacterium]